MAIAGAHRLVDLPSSWCFEHGFLAVALGRFARILRRSMIRRIAVLPSCPTTICDTHNNGDEERDREQDREEHEGYFFRFFVATARRLRRRDEVFDGKSNGALWTSCSMIRMRSVGCGVLDVVGRCVGGVDGRSVGSAAAKTAPKIEKNAK